MGFLQKEDFRSSISLSAVDSLTGNEEEILMTISRQAEEEMKAYLSLRYDTQSVFNALGEDRNELILMYCKDLAIYHLYSISTLLPIPEVRATRYRQAHRWLKLVTEQKINPVGLPLSELSLIKPGGNQKRSNHQK